MTLKTNMIYALLIVRIISSESKAIHVKPDIKIDNDRENDTGLLKKALQSFQMINGKMTNGLLGLNRSKRDLQGIFQFIYIQRSNIFV